MLTRISSLLLALYFGYAMPPSVPKSVSADTPVQPPGAAVSGRDSTPVPHPEQLLAEAKIRKAPQADNTDIYVYLPVTLQGHAVTLLLDFDGGGDLVLWPDKMDAQGIILSDSAQVDSLTIGTTLVRHLAIQATQSSELNQPDLPPVIGTLGQDFLAHYDFVFDGPAHRVLLYAPRPTSLGAADLPPGVTAASCTPLLLTPDHSPIFEIRADGHPLQAEFQIGSYTKMNMVAARMLGLTQHSPQIHPLPADVWEKQDGRGNAIKYEARDIHLTLGTHQFTEVPIHIFPYLAGDRANPRPRISVTPHILGGVLFVLSNSTGQACLGTPHVPSGQPR